VGCGSSVDAVYTLSSHYLPVISSYISDKTIMRSPVTLLTFIGCVLVLFPKAALGRTVPHYVYREPPTSSPTSSPSYSHQPSLRPSMQPSLTSSSISRSFMTAEGERSSYGPVFITSLIGALLCLVGVGYALIRRKRNRSTPEPIEEDGGGWLPSFWGNDSASVSGS